MVAARARAAGSGMGRGWRQRRRRTPGGRCRTAAIERRLRRGRTRQWAFPVAVDRPPAGCRHELGILAFATAARRQGLAVVHLGPDLPLQDWLTAAERHRPDAVVIAAPTPSDVAARWRSLKVWSRSRAARILVAIGGRHQDAVVEAPPAREPIGRGTGSLHRAAQHRSCGIGWGQADLGASVCRRGGPRG